MSQIQYRTSPSLLSNILERHNSRGKTKACFRRTSTPSPPPSRRSRQDSLESSYDHFAKQLDESPEDITIRGVQRIWPYVIGGQVVYTPPPRPKPKPQKNFSRNIFNFFKNLNNPLKFFKEECETKSEPKLQEPKERRIFGCTCGNCQTQYYPYKGNKTHGICVNTYGSDRCKVIPEYCHDYVFIYCI